MHRYSFNYFRHDQSQNVMQDINEINNRQHTDLSQLILQRSVTTRKSLLHPIRLHGIHIRRNQPGELTFPLSNPIPITCTRSAPPSMMGPTVKRNGLPDDQQHKQTSYEIAVGENQKICNSLFNLNAFFVSYRHLWLSVHF